MIECFLIHSAIQKLETFRDPAWNPESGKRSCGRMLLSAPVIVINLIIFLSEDYFDRLHQHKTFDEFENQFHIQLNVFQNKK